MGSFVVMMAAVMIIIMMVIRVGNAVGKKKA